MAEGQFRLRIRYHKSGRLRYLSHLELLRTQERMVRRARLPYAISQGFNPRMKAAFGPALGCGTAGAEEYLDIWLLAYVDPHEVLARLQAASVPDLMPDKAWYVADSEPSLTAVLTVGSFEATVDISGIDGDETARRATFDEAVAAVMMGKTIEVVRKKKSKTLNLDEFIIKHPEIVALEGNTATFSFMTRSGDNGSLRPERLIAEISRSAHVELPLVKLARIAQFREEKGRIVPL